MSADNVSPTTRDLSVKGVPLEQLERWQQAAKASGRSLSGWVRATLNAAVETKRPSARRTDGEP